MHKAFPILLTVGLLGIGLFSFAQTTWAVPQCNGPSCVTETAASKTECMTACNNAGKYRGCFDANTCLCADTLADTLQCAGDFVSLLPSEEPSCNKPAPQCKEGAGSGAACLSLCKQLNYPAACSAAAPETKCFCADQVTSDFIKNCVSSTIYSLKLTGLVAAPEGTVSAATADRDRCSATFGGLPDPFCLSGPTNLIEIGAQIVKYLLGLVGGLALLMVVIGGIMLLASGGQEERITKGKATIFWAVIGLALTIMSYYILSFAIGLMTA